MAETTKRIDPTSRRVDGSIDEEIGNKDPKRHYVKANPNDEDTGVPFMETLGYEIELQRPDGPRLRGSKAIKAGSPLTIRGQVVMSCPMEEHVARYLAGQKNADLIQASISRPGGIDGVKNTSIGGGLASVQSVEAVETVRS